MIPWERLPRWLHEHQSEVFWGSFAALAAATLMCGL